MHQECPFYPFLPILCLLTKVKTVFKFIKDKEEIGLTLLAAISL